LILAAAISVWEKNMLFVFLSLLTFILTFFSTFLFKKYHIKIPVEIEIAIIFFLYSGIFLGGVRNFYYKFWWWDTFLHLFSGITLGFTGFMILYIINKRHNLLLKPKTIVIFAFCFAITIGVLWEIFEFSVDSFWGKNMQKARNLSDSYLGVVDTMVDLILNTVGALVASVCGYFYLKKGEIFLVDKIFKKFEKENKNLFKKSVKNNLL